MEEFFKEILERAHYYEQFEFFREYKGHGKLSEMESNREGESGRKNNN